MILECQIEFVEQLVGIANLFVAFRTIRIVYPEYIWINLQSMLKIFDCLAMITHLSVTYSHSKKYVRIKGIVFIRRLL